MLFIRLITNSIAFEQLGEVYEELRSHLEAFHELQGGGQQKGGTLRLLRCTLPFINKYVN
jgi:hypothetical protein